MKPRRAALSAVTLLALLLAGCSDGGGASPDEELVIPSQTVIDDGETDDVASGDLPSEATPKGGERGHLTGYVMDDALHPLEGATLSLPGLEEERTSLDDGSFAFADLWPGPYRLEARAPGHRPAEAIISVEPDGFTQVKVILAREAPPDPYHETHSMRGFMDVTSADVGGVFSINLMGCNECDFDLVPDGPNLQGIVIEGVMDPHQTGGTHQFALTVRQDGSSGATVYSGTQQNPFRLHLTPEQLGDAESWWIRAWPTGTPPEFGKEFQVFMTAFYNEPPSENWAFIR
ncbi:MAG: carboxypeptidase-like regulatory domain-containing protein [Thermoplasmatota archaeon]